MNVWNWSLRTQKPAVNCSKSVGRPPCKDEIVSVHPLCTDNSGEKDKVTFRIES